MPERLGKILDFAASERLSGVLATKIRDSLGDDLPAFRFSPIPRGGLFVLGFLSYQLGLDRERLAEPSTGAPLVIVDDCGLSGARLASALERAAGSERIIVAHLCSHPGFRRAVLDQEPRVEACLAAQDLDDWKAFSPADPAAFEDRWRRRLPGRRYWLGAVEPLAFPWGQPERVLWKGSEREPEIGWRWASPGRCLADRIALGESAIERGPLGFDLPDQVFWQWLGDRGLRLWHSGLDRAFGLEGAAAEMWKGLMILGDRQLVLDRLERDFDVSRDRLQQDLDKLIERLIRRGLLVVLPSGGGRVPVPAGG